MDWKKIVGTVAPSLASALGGPLAGMAVTAIANAVGLPTGATEEQVAKAVKAASPELLAQIKAADQAFAIRMRELDIDLDRIAAGDRDSARRMQVDTRSYIPGALAIAVTFGFFGILGFMLTNPIPEAGRDALMIMLGSLGTAWTSIVAFYFGSSAGSAAKDKTINAALAK